MVMLFILFFLADSYQLISLDRNRCFFLLFDPFWFTVLIDDCLLVVCSLGSYLFLWVSQFRNGTHPIFLKIQKLEMKGIDKSFKVVKCDEFESTKSPRVILTLHILRQAG